jgi:hypothetical protein
VWWLLSGAGCNRRYPQLMLMFRVDSTPDRIYNLSARRSSLCIPLFMPIPPFVRGPPWVFCEICLLVLSVLYQDGGRRVVPTPHIDGYPPTNSESSALYTLHTSITPNAFLPLASHPCHLFSVSILLPVVVNNHPTDGYSLHLPRKPIIGRWLKGSLP